MPCLIDFDLGLMLSVCSLTSRKTPDISSRFHVNMSMLRWRKSTSSPSYLGSRPVPICTILVGFPTLICTALASSSTLKAPPVEGISGLSSIAGSQRLSSLSSVASIAALASSMLLYSQSSACCALASMVMTPAGPRILSLRNA
jgi:hypothetical protein